MKNIYVVTIGVVTLILLGVVAVVVVKNATGVVPISTMAEFHSKNGYTITYPKNWTVDDSQQSVPAELIREPNGRAFFSMQTIFDPRITKPAEMPQVHRDVEQSFKNNPSYLVEWSEWEKEDKTIAENSYFVAGSYVEDGKSWRFKEITIFTKSGTALILRGATLKEYSKDFGSILDDIIFSVQPDDKNASYVNQTQALFKIKTRPEVVKYEADLRKAGKKASFETQDDGEQWSIQVFEIVKNGDEPSHTATFGWYTVNKKTGKINKDL